MPEAQAYRNIATGELIQWKTAEMRGNKPFYGFCGFMSEQDALFERLARERNITVEEMKGIISARILKGRNNLNPIRPGQWRKIPCSGEVPASEEWMQYTFRK